MQRLSAIFLIATLVTGLPVAAETSDTEHIRHVMQSTWDRPDARVEVDPIFTTDEYAVAGWTQGDTGGRALLRKRGTHWAVILCAGDQLTQLPTMQMAGVPLTAAASLIAKLAAAEQQIGSRRLAMFSRFDGLMMVEQHSGGGHAKH